MADVVVVGSGLAGLAAAARLAKLRHRVTVIERNPMIGGALRGIERDGFHWDSGAVTTTLPAVLRDLFRKSGRPFESYLDIQLSNPSRRHIFPDGAVVDLPTGSRAGQIAAVDAGLGQGAGLQWARYVDQQADRWQLLRSLVLDDPQGGARLSDREVIRHLDARQSLAQHLKRSLTDARLRTIASSGFVLAGSDPARVPAYAAVESYVERNFGLWQVRGGMAALIEALYTRLSERGVAVRCGETVTGVVTRGGAVSGVETAAGHPIAADVVVCAIDPRVVFGLLPTSLSRSGRRVFDAARPVTPPHITHVGLRGAVPDLPAETVLHGAPLITIRRQLHELTGADREDSAAAPPDRAWTILRRGSDDVDVLTTLATRGIDVRSQVLARVDRSPDEVVAETGGSSYGFEWDGWRASARRAALTNPLPGLHLIGASMHPGSSIPYAAWGAAHVAERLGRA